MNKNVKNYFNEMQVVGKKLKEQRLKSKLTPNEVGEVLGCTYQTVIAYEAGRRTPKDNVKCLLCNLYGVSIQDMFFSKG